LEHLANPAFQFRHPVRLINKAHGPHLSDPGDVLGRKEARSHQHPHLGIQGPKILEHLQAVPARQVIVQNHQVHPPQALEDVQGFLAILGHLHLIPQVFQEFLSQRADQDIIVNQQD